MEKIVASRLSNAASLTGVNSQEHFGCLPQRAADDALQTLLSPAQAWLRTTSPYNKGTGWQQPVRQAIFTNDIDGAFNCVIYQRLVELLTLMKLPRYLVSWIGASGIDRFTSLAFDGLVEPPQPLNTGLPLGSPLLSILFVI